jgi:hypothetical protein
MRAATRAPQNTRLGLLYAVAALACAGQGPVVEAQVLEIDPPTLRRIAVAPFLPSATFKGDAPAGESTGAEAADAAALTTRFVTEAFAAQGFEMVAASDLVNAFTAQGKPVPHGEPAQFARVAALEFGATALMVGEVYRYRARQGGELGAARPASVGFTVAVYATSDTRQLWKARFDKTQPALSENVMEARRYPGSGSRWLSAAELTRWGASETAKRLLELK